MLRSIGVICLIAVVIGPVVWIADLLGARTTFITVKQAFVSMVVALFVANATAILHVALVSRLPKRKKWDWLHRTMTPFEPFAAFEYLMRDRARD